MSDSLINEPNVTATPDPTDAEFDDTSERPDPELSLADLDLNLLTHPVVLRAIVGVLVATAVIVWPERTDQILARLIGLAAVGFGAISIWTSIRHKPRQRHRLLTGVATLAVGAILMAVPPGDADATLGRLLGLAAIVIAVRLAGRAFRDPDVDRVWSLAQAGMLACGAALLLVFPTDVLTVSIAAIGIGWLALGVIAIGMSLDRSTEGVASYTDAGAVIARWVAERPKGADDRRALYAKILYDGPHTGRRVVRFFTLMGFAAVIASTGVIGDSTAVVIGAMLIAPLMTPLMGMAISLVMGWPNRLGRSTIIAVGGIAFAITIGMIVGFFSPVPIDTATNSQILARTSPTTLDLLIAIAAGAAGAYGLSRPDVSDSLPGVAIAISLVPPLSVVGISYSQGDWAAGSGALLLFATNMLAILIVGGLTFIATGVTPLARFTENQHRTRTAAAAIGGLAAIVVGALLLNATAIARDVAAQNDANRVVEAWLEPFPDHNIIEVGVDGDTVVAVIIGPSEGSPPATELAGQLATELGREMEARVRLVVEERDIATATP